MNDTALPQSIKDMIAQVQQKMAHRPKLAAMFEKCFSNTYQTTIKRLQDGTTFIITGDIPAMWLRDSACQIRPYLSLAREDEHFYELISGLVERQLQFVLLDPYANAFNEEENGHGHQSDQTEMHPHVWERKYEIDSLCYPLQLSYLLWKASGRTDHLNETFLAAAGTIIDVWITEQDHEANSPYTFERPGAPAIDSLTREGKGSFAEPTGMTWSGFRPSDDACVYGYLVPSNMFATVVLGYIKQIAEEVFSDTALAQRAHDLCEQIEGGIESYGITEHEQYGSIYVYETDGMGHNHFMDDANVPSLLSIPYLGYRDVHDPIYQNTRRFILSKENPYYYEGKAASGIGSPHTPEGYIWHIALAMQGLTASSREEREKILDILEATDADTGVMHEGFSADNPYEFTRPWFSWANALFSELVMEECGLGLQLNV
ncbi:glycoside hydrolase family 125 protein [Metabacillus sp. GX 13764]|uniref:glycoside hydrolase family 125 protein n=1 Tax=Metabacillus kandeliae TaxID=2900151 RepID=UPI001E4B90DC|nr:glycoside hydrolase family 125 protein [Metabacillus kandeliae]MCD7034621.1 glycoside hydrolase family 125 protein [Metabacillus kandeliae]